jgi:hypothetical protein
MSGSFASSVLLKFGLRGKVTGVTGEDALTSRFEPWAAEERAQNFHDRGH